MDADAFADVIGAVSDFAGGSLLITLGTLAGIGALAMALVQIVKELTPMRGMLQRRWFAAWLAKHGAEVDQEIQKLPGAPYDDTGQNQLEVSLAEVTVGGEAPVLFELAGDVITEQILRSAPVILDNPRQYARLLARLAFGAASIDLNIVFDAALRADFSGNDYYDARARVLRRIERNLEGIALVVTARWRVWMHLASILGTLAVVVCALVLDRRPFSVSIAIAAGAVSLLGGYFAPAAKDIVATLQEFRQRKTL